MKFVLNSIAENKFPTLLHFRCSVKVPENGIPPEWYNYFLCGVKGIYDVLPNGPQSGMFVAVSGNVPPAAGLSSSSALVSAATLATSFANQVSLKFAAFFLHCFFFQPFFYVHTVQFEQKNAGRSIGKM